MCTDKKYVIFSHGDLFFHNKTRGFKDGCGALTVTRQYVKIPFGYGRK